MYLEECFLFWGTEPVPLFDPRITLEEGARGYAAGDPLYGDHVAALTNHRCLATLLDKMSLDACKHI